MRLTSDGVPYGNVYIYVGHESAIARRTGPKPHLVRRQVKRLSPQKLPASYMQPTQIVAQPTHKAVVH